MSNTLSPADSRKRKYKALLAGGVVLGLGATMTLAAWSDTEYANGVFSAGKFNVQGNPSPLSPPAAASWADNYVANGAGLTFSTNFSNLTPDTTVYAPFSLRIDPSKASYDARVHIESVTSTGDLNLLGKLTWKARTGIAPATCAAMTPATYTTGGTALVPSPDATPGSTVNNYTALATPTTFTLSKANAPSETTPVTVCIAVTLPAQPANTPPTEASWNFTSPVTTTWKFSATSV